MRRLHLFEFEDQKWLPPPLRRYLLEFLQFQIVSERIYAGAIPKLREALAKARCRKLVDIGSGGGATILHVQALLRQAGWPVSVTMSDKYPQAGAIPPGAGAADGGALYHPEPVDALSIPSELDGLRTFFTSFHHFRPAEAAAILRQAVEDRAPIAVFEFTQRRAGNLLGMLLSPVAVLAGMRKARPWTFGKFFWTYVLPAVPLLYWWDGTVSHWRTYSVAELKDLIARLGETRFEWEVGRIGDGRAALTYLLGIPQGLAEAGKAR
jgi:hypothetical protein